MLEWLCFLVGLIVSLFVVDWFDLYVLGQRPDIAWGTLNLIGAALALAVFAIIKIWRDPDILQGNVVCFLWGLAAFVPAIGTPLLCLFLAKLMS
ncbi:MAG: hypothetical protein QM754_11040 [Tepidisphaeraceae bacterium]